MVNTIRRGRRVCASSKTHVAPTELPLKQIKQTKGGGQLIILLSQLKHSHIRQSHWVMGRNGAIQRKQGQLWSLGHFATNDCHIGRNQARNHPMMGQQLNSLRNIELMESSYLFDADDQSYFQMLNLCSQGCLITSSSNVAEFSIFEEKMLKVWYLLWDHTSSHPLNHQFQSGLPFEWCRATNQNRDHLRTSVLKAQQHKVSLQLVLNWDLQGNHNESLTGHGLSKPCLLTFRASR